MKQTGGRIISGVTALLSLRRRDDLQQFDLEHQRRAVDRGMSGGTCGRRHATFSVRTFALLI